MRQHIPTLYPHPEQDNDPDGEDADHWDDDHTSRPQAHTNGSSFASTSFTPSRGKPRNSNSFTGTSTTNYSANPASVNKYAIYSQFVQRYRSSESAAGDDLRNDPDSHYYQKGLGQLVDAGDSDDDDIPRSSLASGSEGIDRSSALLESEHIESATTQERERLEWRTMLASVLGGDVLKSEKTRMAVALESSADEQNNIHLNIWLGIRARFHGRSEEEEKKRLEERRLRTVDAVIDEINNFRCASDNPDATAALKQVAFVIRRLDVAQSLYPNLKAFYLAKPAAAKSRFQARCDTLHTWSTVLTSLRHQIDLLRRWTGSGTLDVTQPNTSAEIPIGTHPARLVKNGPTEIADGTSFVERILKDESMQRTFEKGFLTTVHAFIGAARDAQVNLAPLFKEMNLPTFERELGPLISFPTKLAQASLRVRLDYVQKLKDPDVLIIDQMTEDLKLSIGLACTLKRQYEAFLTPDPSGKWNLPQCISEDYDSSILEALTIFFRLIHWKLKSGVKGIYFKETDVLEAQWATFNDVSLTVNGGSALVAEELCALINKLMLRVTNYFQTQVLVPKSEDSERHPPDEPNVNGSRSAFQSHVHGRVVSKIMTDEQMFSWYGKILDGVRLRYRKLQRFARVLAQRFDNCAQYDLEDVPLEHFINTLALTDHFLVYTHTFEEDGTYIIASSVLYDRPQAIRRILTEAFHVEEVTNDDGRRVAGDANIWGDEYYEGGYVLALSPRSQFTWTGRVFMLDINKVELELHDNRVLLIADGPQRRLSIAKQHFDDIFLPVDEDGEPLPSVMGPLTCLVEQQAHLPRVERELRKIVRSTTKLAESIVRSVSTVRNSLRMVNGCQELLENWYLFASEHGQHALKYMEQKSVPGFHVLLLHLAISWVAFLCDDCDPADEKMFKWTVNALEFTYSRTKRGNIFVLPDDEFILLQTKVAGCMSLLSRHFDILGARKTVIARREKERQEEMVRQQTSDLDEEDDFSRSLSPDHDDNLASMEPRTRMFWERISRSIQELEESRIVIGIETRTLGRVLDDEKPEDRSLVFLASSSSNISMRWQQGRFIGAGAFGSVYLAVNLDSGSLMAVKEIKFQELSGLPNLYSQIKDELSVMEMLHHPNVVEYYGIEVHRDKVYIFEEYCQGGSLAALLEHGRIEDEGIIQVYTMQMLEGLAYLHSKGIVHRDIKPDNILLDHLGVIKFVDFGAAKILAKNQRSIQRSRRAPETAPPVGPGMPNIAGLGMNNSLTGTPMYMSPEIIKNDKRGRYGAMDIWSLGCVVLEFATGKKPWSNLDNEWAIMFHIGVATQHPPLPEPGQLSELGINFIKQCLTIDPMKRPSANDLMDHPWIMEFREALLSYEEAEIATSPRPEIPTDGAFEHATVARQAAIIQEKEIEAIKRASPVTPSSASDSDSSLPR